MPIRVKIAKRILHQLFDSARRNRKNLQCQTKLANLQCHKTYKFLFRSK